MEVLVQISAVGLGIVGILGCILPVIPGPPLSYTGLLILYLWANHPLPGGVDNEITGRFMIVWLVITVVVSILDYLVPAFFTKLTGGSREAVRGSVAGMLVGVVFFPPFGILAGAFLGALLGEIIFNRKNIGASLLSASGAFLGFIFGTGLKLTASGVMLYYMFVYIF